MVEKITLIRHAETPWNKERLLQGHSDVSLSEHGEFQAKCLAKYMENASSPDILYVSDLVRTKLTAEYLLKTHRCNVVMEPLLRERSFGIFEGKYLQELQAHMRYIVDEEKISVFDYAPPSGESLNDVLKRIQKFLDKLYLRPEKNIWIVSHGGVILRFLKLILGENNIEIATGYDVFNTSVSEVLYENETWHPIKINCVKHLEGY